MERTETMQQDKNSEKLPGIKHIIAVGSGKGGVGKSTVSVNLALALSRSGYRVGLVDADLYGPSIPGMLGIPFGEPPARTEEGKIVPAIRHEIKVISMGMLSGDDSPAILRGPMVSRYLQMFIGAVDWGRLDYLILDLPPGTGDTQLTLAQSVPLSGAIIVTTPQDVSLKIARRGLRMFETVHVPILGLIENMSGFCCPHCGKGTNIFRSGGGKKMSEALGVPFLGAIPLDADVVECGDSGKPILLEKPDAPASLAYFNIAEEFSARVHDLNSVGLKAFVWNWVSGDGAPQWHHHAIRKNGSPTTAVGFKRFDNRTLSILWEDGEEQDFDLRDLRINCRCAACVEETSGRALLDPQKIPENIEPQTITSIGNYAITFSWNDGHSTGIYAFDHLRALGDEPREKRIPSGASAISSSPAPARNGARTDDEIRVILKNLLDSEVNPAIASHGGKISMLDYRAGKLAIAMSGGCQGCASSQMTLRQGVETMVKRAVPEVSQIVDLTNHAAGKNPFYTGTGQA